MSYYGGGPGGPGGPSGGNYYDPYAGGLDYPTHNLNGDQQRFVLERQQALVQRGLYPVTPEDLALDTGLHVDQIRAFLYSQPQAAPQQWSGQQAESYYAPSQASGAYSHFDPSSAYTQAPPTGPSYPPSQAGYDYGAYSPYPPQMGPQPSSSALRTRPIIPIEVQPSSSALRTRPIIPIEVQPSSRASQHPNYPSTPYTRGPQPSGPSYAPPHALGAHGGDEDSLFGGSPPQSPVDPGHGFALPSAAGSMVQLPGAPVRQSSVAPLRASRYDPYAAASAGSSRLPRPPGGRGGEASGPPPVTLADVQNARAKATTGRLRPPKRKPTSAAIRSSAQAGSSSSAVTVYRYESKTDRDTMAKLGGYKRGTDNENNNYLITPLGEVFRIPTRNEKEFQTTAYYQAMAGLREAANLKGVHLGDVGELFGMSVYWLRNPNPGNRPGNRRATG
jgi:hypothetical protein